MIRRILWTLAWGIACAIAGGLAFYPVSRLFGELTGLACASAVGVAGMAACVLSERQRCEP